jgi:hypothetical protein
MITGQEKAQDDAARRGNVSLPPASSAEAVKTGADAVVVDFNCWRDKYEGHMHIDGHARNTSGRLLSYVEVDFNLYDQSGAQIGSTMANISNLEPNGVWAFEAPIVEYWASSARLIKTSAF